MRRVLSGIYLAVKGRGRGTWLTKVTRASSFDDLTNGTDGSSPRKDHTTEGEQVTLVDHVPQAAGAISMNFAGHRQAVHEGSRAGASRLDGGHPSEDKGREECPPNPFGLAAPKRQAKGVRPA